VIQRTLTSLTNEKEFVIAYSGGLDSHVLLHMMAEFKKNNPDVKIQAIHVNHQLNPQSNKWAEHCEKICNALNVLLTIEKIHIAVAPGDSLEENARNARYDIFKKYLDKHKVLLTAHHLNDQAETFLLQALRGAGSKGLSAMPVRKKFGDSFLIRPLLSFSRDALEKYAHENKLVWIEDDSNQDPKFRRNFLRHEVFPLLKTYYPSVMQNFSRSARLIAEQEKIITEIIKSDFEKIKCHDPKKIDLKKLREFSAEKQRLLLREWFAQNQLRMPNEKHLKQIQKDVVNAASDAQPVFRFAHLEISRDRSHLIFYFPPR
jgi:tRNA(Ile)-lysidine synthase